MRSGVCRHSRVRGRCPHRGEWKWPLEGSRRTHARAPPATPWNIVLSSDVEREDLTAEGADCIEFGALLDDFNILLRDAFYLMRALRTLASEGWWGPDRWNEALRHGPWRARRGLGVSAMSPAKSPLSLAELWYELGYDLHNLL